MIQDAKKVLVRVKWMDGQAVKSPLSAVMGKISFVSMDVTRNDKVYVMKHTDFSPSFDRRFSMLTERNK